MTTADGEPRLGADLFGRKLPLTLDSPLSADAVLERAWVNLDVQTELLHEAARQFLESVNQPAGRGGQPGRHSRGDTGPARQP